MNLNSVTSVSWIERYPAEEVDAVLANILAPVLIEESASIQNCLKDGGVVVLSGMREEQCASVVSQYTQCFEITRETLEGWCAVVLRKTSDTQL
jgi:ribosomal protein L11 methylase PrmA